MNEKQRCIARRNSKKLNDANCERKKEGRREKKERREKKNKESQRSSECRMKEKWNERGGTGREERKGKRIEEKVN